ncbi:unnamed protein product [Urochloa humidicola]
MRAWPLTHSQSPPGWPLGAGRLRSPSDSPPPAEATDYIAAACAGRLLVPANPRRPAVPGSRVWFCASPAMDVMDDDVLRLFLERVDSHVSLVRPAAVCRRWRRHSPPATATTLTPHVVRKDERCLSPRRRR